MTSTTEIKFNYDSIKYLAKEAKMTVADLCALAPSNDPFYTGRPAEVTAAKWFAALWAKFGYGSGVHLRRMHYRIVSQEVPLSRPNGKAYQNTLNDWEYLLSAGKWARYLGLIEAGKFTDKRNPDPVIKAEWLRPDDYNYINPNPGYELAPQQLDTDYGIYMPALADLPADSPPHPEMQTTGYYYDNEFDYYSEVEQQAHVEIWCEKTTINDILLPLCERYGVNLVTGAGEMSITSVVEFLQRARKADLPARILYISDYDPAGLGMPISVARKIEFFQQEENWGDLDIKLQPIVLNPEQVTQYDLPRIPVKDSDLRKANWEEKHGQGQVELDALEALYPGVLSGIVEEEIRRYYDPSLRQKTRQAHQNLQQALLEATEEIKSLDPHRESLENVDIEYNDLLAEYEQIQAEFQDMVTGFWPRVESFQDSLGEFLAYSGEVNGKLADSLEAIDLDLTDPDYTLPEADIQDDNYQLYESGRDYLNQLAVYKNRRNNNE